MCGLYSVVIPSFLRFCRHSSASLKFRSSRTQRCTHTLQQGHQFGFATITDWAEFCREAMLHWVLDCSQNISGPNKIVKIDETKFARRKCHWTHVVKGQWMFGGVKRESRKTFLVPVYDRTANTLLVVLRYQSNPALQSSATAGRRIGTWKRKATHIKPSTIQSFRFCAHWGKYEHDR